MKDISTVLEKALLYSSKYNPDELSLQIERISDIWCRLEDDSNLKWYLISKNDGKLVVEYYGYLSVKFPVALLMKNCPNNIRKLLIENKVFLEEYCDRYSCDETILKKYVEDKVLIDDRFLYDGYIPFSEELFLKIDEGIDYLTPYNFRFDDIK